MRTTDNLADEYLYCVKGTKGSDPSSLGCGDEGSDPLVPVYRRTCRFFSKNCAIALMELFQFRHNNGSWTSSGRTSSSTFTPLSESRRFKSTVWRKSTVRSSSP